MIKLDATFTTVTVLLSALIVCTAAISQTQSEPVITTPIPPFVLQHESTAKPDANPPASFVGQTQTGKRYRWLAQTVSLGGTHGKDCHKNMLALPWVSYEETGAPTYKNPHDPAQPWYHSPSFQKTLTDPKQLAAANNDARLIALRYPFPKLKGQVYGFDADGIRTGELLLNADLLNISIYHEGACVQAQYPAGTAADRAYRDREHRYAKAVQALFQNGAYTAPGGAPELAALSKTVVFSNDPDDLPHVPKAQPAPADIAAKLNARLKAKLARDLDRERLSLQQQIAALKSPAGLAQVANRTVDGRAPTAAENEEKAAYVSSVHQLALDVLPTNIDVVFVACPSLQYALDAQGSRMLYMLRCSGSVFGFYEQSISGDIVLVKIADRRTAQQKQAGMDVHPFVSGLAKFHLRSWTEPYASAWRERWLINQDPATRRTTPNLLAAKYMKGKVQESDGTDFYVQIKGVFDLLPMRSVPLAQLYLSSTGHHESPFELAGFEPGAKPGDPWTERKQTWPVGMQE